MPRLPWMLALAWVVCCGGLLRAEHRLAASPASPVAEERADRAATGPVGRTKPFRRPPLLPGSKSATNRVVRASANEPVSNSNGPRLSPPKDTASRAATPETADSSAKRPRLDSPLALLGGLGIVLGLFLVLAWGFRRGAARPAPLAPAEAVEVLGRAQIVGRQTLHLLRCGNKVLLVYFTPTGAATLTEITDPAEVDRLCALCYQARPGSASLAFRGVFAQLGSERAATSRWSSGRRERTTLSAQEDDDGVVREGRRA